MTKGIVVLIMLVLFFDQTTKYWALQTAPCTILPTLNFVMAHNTGITFGLLPNLSPVLIWAGALGIVSFVIWSLLTAQTTTEKTAYSFIIGGAIGNLIDRLRFGYVIDFIDLHIGTWHYPWPFNVADSFIVIGIILLIAHPGKKLGTYV